MADGKNPVTSELFHTYNILRASDDLRAVLVHGLLRIKGALVKVCIGLSCLPVWYKLSHARSLA